MANKIVGSFVKTQDLLNLDTTKAIDTNKGINGDIFFGMADMYYESLAAMEQQFAQIISDINKSYDKEEYKNINDKCAELMGSCQMMAISGLYYTCYYMTELYTFEMYN